jgi:hypothetical protein
MEFKFPVDAPFLATCTGSWFGRSKCRMNVRGGLRYISGNRLPHFSLTANILSGGHAVGGGCMHEEILKRFPKFADLARLHLSDINGEPMHAVENGFYALAGYFGGLGQRYHAGNSKQSFHDGYREPIRNECLEQFARHMRIEVDRARSWTDNVWADRTPQDAVRVKALLVDEVELRRPIWKEEAEDCIRKHGLRVYGDKWEGTV